MVEISIYSVRVYHSLFKVIANGQRQNLNFPLGEPHSELGNTQSALGSIRLDSENDSVLNNSSTTENIFDRMRLTIKPSESHPIYLEIKIMELFNQLTNYKKCRSNSEYFKDIALQAIRPLSDDERKCLIDYINKKPV